MTEYEPRDRLGCTLRVLVVVGCRPGNIPRTQCTDHADLRWPGADKAPQGT